MISETWCWDGCYKNSLFFAVFGIYLLCRYRKFWAEHAENTLKNLSTKCNLMPSRMEKCKMRIYDFVLVLSIGMEVSGELINNFWMKII